jgi:hypothetical protein
MNSERKNVNELIFYFLQNETSLPMEQVLSPRIEVTTLPLETTAIIKKEV